MMSKRIALILPQAGACGPTCSNRAGLRGAQLRIARAAMSTRTQISCASGISSSPCGESTTRIGVPATPSPVICTSRTIPIAARSHRARLPVFAHFAAGEVRDVVAPGGKRHAFGERNLHFQADKLFRVGNRIASLRSEKSPGRRGSGSASRSESPTRARLGSRAHHAIPPI